MRPSIGEGEVPVTAVRRTPRPHRRVDGRDRSRFGSYVDKMKE